MLGLWRMQNTPSLPSLLGQLWSEVVAPDRVLSIDQIDGLVWFLCLMAYQPSLVI